MIGKFVSFILAMFLIIKLNFPFFFFFFIQNTSEKMIISSCIRRMSDSIDKRFCFDLASDDRYVELINLYVLTLIFDFFYIYFSKTWSNLHISSII